MYAYADDEKLMLEILCTTRKNCKEAGITVSPEGEKHTTILNALLARVPPFPEELTVYSGYPIYGNSLPDIKTIINKQDVIPHSTSRKKELAENFMFGTPLAGGVFDFTNGAPTLGQLRIIRLSKGSRGLFLPYLYQASLLELLEVEKRGDDWEAAEEELKEKKLIKRSSNTAEEEEILLHPCTKISFDKKEEIYPFSRSLTMKEGGDTQKLTLMAHPALVQADSSDKVDLNACLKDRPWWKFK